MSTKMHTYNVSEELNRTFGAPGTFRRKQAEKQAWADYHNQVCQETSNQNHNSGHCAKPTKEQKTDRHSPNK
jgi:hypothetical protein